MNIGENDNREIHCQAMGHDVPFSYCRKGAAAQPCRKIFDCWYQFFDIERFMQDHYTQDQIHRILSPPQPKLTTLIDLIQRAKESAVKNRADRDEGGGS
ncbi:MAG: hypothetical protein L0Y36_01255 [Planctomycetales bacterium]|nr:hypothetical protein [Planctomycetales bacterium]